MEEPQRRQRIVETVRIDSAVCLTEEEKEKRIAVNHAREMISKKCLLFLYRKPWIIIWLNHKNDTAVQEIEERELLEKKN